MVTDETKKNKTKSEPSFKEAGGVHGWLLKKAKTFMWDSASNTLILPKGVVLSKEEKEALEAVIGTIRDEAAVVDQHRQMQMAAAQKAGVQFKANVVKGYDLLVSGSYRELTGVFARKIHENLAGMLQVDKHFVQNMWKVISGKLQEQPSKKQAKIRPTAGRER
jgi:hypothetical protein